MVYELLPLYGLPPGLLPDMVKSFELTGDGCLVVELEGPFCVEFEYLVYYETRISGVVKYDSIEDLQGIQVGWITKKLNVGQSETVHARTTGWPSE